MTKEFKVRLNSVDKVKEFVNIVGKIDGDFDLVKGRYVIDAKSIMGIFSLDLSKDLILVVRSGDAAQVEEKLNNFIV